VRLALKVVMQNDVDFVDVILLYESKLDGRSTSSRFYSSAAAVFHFFFVKGPAADATDAPQP
jgi:hypothetical protein